ncbi:MAG: IS66 family transposase [Prevotella sp.]|nr:IS66 family transposase [Prevotella sp.]
MLKEFLGDAKIKSLQSDGYNVYMYLDEEMVDVEHICCLAHVHNKLQEAKRLCIFNTFISTCLQKCRNFRNFFVDYVREWNRGRRDYDNLVRLAFSPATN